MFDSIEDQMKNAQMEGSPKEKWTRYAIIGAISVCAVGTIFVAMRFF
jgi:hypothetical protein